MRHMRHKKKAVLGISLIELIYLIISIGIIFFLISLGISFYNFFVKGNDYESTANNLEALKIKIEELIGKEGLAISTMPYFISDDFILVGFNKDLTQGKISSTESVFVQDIEQTRPPLCKSKSCLCLYEDHSGNDFTKETAPLDCKVFDQDIIFLAFSGKKIGSSKENVDTAIEEDFLFKGQLYPINSKYHDYEFLVLYGEGKTALSDDDFGVRNLYIEKWQEGDQNIIFIAQYRKEDANDPIFKRKLALESAMRSDEDLGDYSKDDWSQTNW